MDADGPQVPDDDDDLQEPDGAHGPNAAGAYGPAEDPWGQYRAASSPPPGFTPSQGERGGPRDGMTDEEMAWFEVFVRNREEQRRRARRRIQEEEDDEDDGPAQARGNAGPPPSWDGQTPFKDYLIRARLWLATTKVRPRARGPMLLKNLSGCPFDDLKYLAQDTSWMEDPKNGEKLLEKMDTKELYGDDAREDMLQSLVRITYTLRRQKGETHRSFFAKCGTTP